MPSKVTDGEIRGHKDVIFMKQIILLPFFESDIKCNKELFSFIEDVFLPFLNMLHIFITEITITSEIFYNTNKHIIQNIIVYTCMYIHTYITA